MKKTISKLSQIFVYALILVLGISMVFASQSAVNLGTAGNFEVLAKTGISTTGTTAITGDIGVSPAAATFITGFGLIADSSNTFATSPIVVGKVYAADYTPLTPTAMTTAIGDMQTAYTDAAGRTLPDHTELGAGNIDGMTLSAGLYKWGTGVTIPTGVTLSGSATDVWVFQIAQDLNLGNGAIVTLAGGAQAKNIFWQVAGQVTLGTTSAMKGVILSQTAIVLNTGAKLNGKALAQTAVTLDANSVSLQAATTSVTSPPVTNTASNVVVNNNRNDNIEVRGNASTTYTANGTKIMPILVNVIDSDSRRNESNQTNKLNETKEQMELNNANRGIGQNLSMLISERREEIKSGDYNGSFGQLLQVHELSSDLRELRVDEISARTYLNITADTDKDGKTRFKAMLRNGREIEIKYMPNNASKIALEKLGQHVCSTANNCTIQLKDVGNESTEKIQYEVQLDRSSKVFGIFAKTMHVSVDVDAQDGTTNVHKPWWSVLATQPVE